MASYTQVGGVAVDAFQWKGDPLSGYDLPGWAKVMALHAPQDGTLHVPCSTGTFSARMGDWIWQGPDGNTYVSTDTLFSAMFNTAPDESKTTDTRRNGGRSTKPDAGETPSA